MGTRYDPATPYKEAQRLTAQLGNARLLTMTGDGHTAYDGYPADGYNSECVDDAVKEYLFGLALPAVGTKCAQDQEAFPAPDADRGAGSRRRAAPDRGAAAHAAAASAVAGLTRGQPGRGAYFVPRPGWVPWWPNGDPRSFAP